MISYNGHEVVLQEVEGQCCCVKRKDGYCFNQGTTVLVVPINSLCSDGNELETVLRRLRAKQQQEGHK